MKGGDGYLMDTAGSLDQYNNSRSTAPETDGHGAPYGFSTQHRMGKIGTATSG